MPITPNNPAPQGHAPLLMQQLREAIAASKLQKSEIAERAGLSRRALYSLLEGSADPRIGTVEAVARVLGLELQLVPRLVVRTAINRPTTTGPSPFSRNAQLQKRSAAKVIHMMKAMKK
ncbi:helix-turn-helix domain-containing protein [Comamonas thiooxydans]|uniref:helix-turn-helix domain-containing protein n=1 Tax=Comamonas thiooxydans TaxID=363952 RepID=UPI000B4122DF|nr:helix-turn-helix domain-containing protein [Comamonas thiooxydans]